MRRPAGMTLLTASAVAVIVFLLVLPLTVQLIASLRGPYLPFGVPSAQWGFEAYRQLYGAQGDFLAVVVTTFAFVGGATLIAGVVAFTMAFLVVRTDLPFRTLLSVLILLPYIIPPIVRAQSWVLMLAPQTGVLNTVIRAVTGSTATTGPIDPFAFETIVIVQGLVSVTFPFLLLVPLMQNMDGSLEEAARASGASALQTLRRVTLPVLFPGTLAILLLATILMLGSLEIPLIFGQEEGGNIFALRMLTVLRGNASELPRYGLAAAYGVNFLVLTFLIFRVYRWVTRDAGRRASVSGKGFRPARLPLGRWKWPVLALVLAYLLPTSLLPAAALMWSAVTPFAMPMTADNFAQYASLESFGAVIVDEEFWASLGRTIVIAGLASTIAVGVAAIAAWVVARSRPSIGPRALDVLASSSVAIPTVIVGFSTFLFYLTINRWVPLIGTIWVLVIAYSYRISVSYRVSFSAILQVNPELEESAAASGASRLATFRRIVIPLLLPTAAAVWIQLFILGAHEFTLPAFLATPETRPLSWYLYSRLNPGAAQQYNPSEGAAMAVIFTVLVFGFALLLRWAIGRRAIGRAKRTQAPTPSTVMDVAAAGQTPL